MGLKDFSYLKTKVRDWEATSYGDIGVSAGIGAGILHLKLWSPSHKFCVNSLILQGKVGMEVDVEMGTELTKLLSKINGGIQNFLKGKDAALSEFSYKKLTCYTAFSISDYLGSFCAGFEESIAAVAGKKISSLKVASLDIGPLFLIPKELETAWGIGGNLTGFSGVVIGVGFQFFEYNMQQRYQMEKNRKPTDLFWGNKML